MLYVKSICNENFDFFLSSLVSLVSQKGVPSFRRSSFRWCEEFHFSCYGVPSTFNVFFHAKNFSSFCLGDIFMWNISFRGTSEIWQIAFTSYLLHRVPKGFSLFFGIGEIFGPAFFFVSCNRNRKRKSYFCLDVISLIREMARNFALRWKYFVFLFFPRRMFLCNTFSQQVCFSLFDMVKIMTLVL